MPALRVNALRRIMSSASAILVKPHPLTRRVVRHKHDNMVLIRHFRRTAGFFFPAVGLALFSWSTMAMVGRKSGI
ncbi:hypothetical protein Vi05172_g13485 [Venturia inaequalis]|nr:hypothetical protein Vi05172_g13485 [Venturia inaequalis]